MSDFEKRLNQIEQKIDTVVHKPPPYYGGSIQQNQSGEIDLRELWSVIWQGKWWIIGITFLFAVAGVFYALSLPNIYKIEGVYAPVQQKSGSSLSGQYGGLAAIAGINIGSDGTSAIDKALKRVVSWPFLESFIVENEVKPFLFAVESWDPVTSSIIWDKDIYDPEIKVWNRIVAPPFLPEPSSYESYDKFLSLLDVSEDQKTGLISISVEHRSPQVAYDFLISIVRFLNEDFKQRDLAKANQNIKYLNSKISETGLAEMRSVFYGMVEDQLQSIMLAEVGDEYLLESVVEPKVAEFKSSPKRSLIVLVILIIGGILSSIGIIAKHFFLNSGGKK